MQSARKLVKVSSSSADPLTQPLSVVQTLTKEGRIRLVANGNTIDILVTIFAPVARFCLRRSFIAQDIIEALKIALIRAATKEIEQNGHEPTVSRLSVITGINRRDVSRIVRGDLRESQQGDLLTRILCNWEQRREFCPRDKKPRPLSVSGEESEFKRLVASVSRDISPATILFELERRGQIARVGDRVALARAENTFTHEPERGTHLLVRDLEALSDAVEENLTQANSVRNLHAHTEFDNVAEEALPQIREWLLERGFEFHKTVRDYLSQFDLDLNPDPRAKGGARVVLGAFSWTSKS